MWPWGHLVFGYLLYSGSTHLRSRGSPDDVATIALAVGTQFPDLLDKPLALFGVFPHGRGMAHSAIVAGFVLVVVSMLVALSTYRMETVVAFGVGYGSHLFGDVVVLLITGDVESTLFLAWPLVPVRESGLEYSLSTFVAMFELSPPVIAQFLLVIPGIAIWWFDGRPGLRPVRRVVRLCTLGATK